MIYSILKELKEILSDDDSAQNRARTQHWERYHALVSRRDASLVNETLGYLRLFQEAP